jgi:predicted DNA-binding ribbon-helix-helix protein
MAKTKGTAIRGPHATGIRLDRNLHRGMRVVAAERGVPTNHLYDEVIGKFLAEARRKPAA